MTELPIAKLTPTITEQLKSGFHPGNPFPFGTVSPISQPTSRDPLKPEKVAIIGTAPSSRLQAPYSDPSWVIWGTSPGNGNGQLPRADAWIEIHSNLMWPENKHYGEPYLKWLNEQTFPVVAQTEYLLPRGTIRYPKREMIKKFGPYFFTSTFAWALALAIDAGVKEIGMWGVDMASKDEYIQQRAGGHYFIQLARNAGIKVYLPEESDLAQHAPLYGFSDSSPMGRKMGVRRQELQGRLNAMQQQHQQNMMAIQYLSGAIEDLDYHNAIWASHLDPDVTAIGDRDG